MIKKKLDVMGFECISLMSHSQMLMRDIFNVYTVGGQNTPLNEHYKSVIRSGIRAIKFKTEELERYLDA